jgi:tetratricopeptide (TPR) repeat protein
MKKLILPFALLFVLQANSQSLDDLWKKYSSKDYAFVLNHISELEKKEPNNIDLQLLLGRTYTDAGMPDKAIPYLLFVSKSDQNKSWRKAWAMTYLGDIYYRKADYSQARKYLDGAIQLNATENVTREAKYKNVLFGFDDHYRNFISKESDHIIFHFEPAAKEKIGDIDQFMQKREESFVQINKFFNSKLPKKIDLFVWGSSESAMTTTGLSAGFAKPEYCISHLVYDQTPGHEITHVISHYSIPSVHKSVLINEGTGVYFDQTNRNRLQYAKEVIKTTGATDVKLMDMWEARPKDQSILYAVAGAFIEYLIDKEGKEKYMQLMKDQSYENAKKVYGEGLNALIAEFEKSLVTGVAQQVLASAFTPIKLDDAEVDKVIEKNNTPDNLYRVLILINSKPVTKHEMFKLHPSEIKELQVVKNKEIIKQYTGVDINGMILILLK